MCYMLCACCARYVYVYIMCYAMHYVLSYHVIVSKTNHESGLHTVSNLHWKDLSRTIRALQTLPDC